MNQNFQGAPDRDDLRILDQLRRQLLPMIAVMTKLQHEMQFKMERGLAVDWPQIQHTTTIVSNYINSFNTMIHGGYQHTTEDIVTKVPKLDENGNIIKDDLGNPVDSGKEATKTIYRDIHNPGQGDRIKALHPFPIPPFPMHLPHAQGMANTLLRKRLEPMEEGWVGKRLQKAAEFAEVPEAWGIEPKKPEAKEEDDEKDGDDEDTREDANAMPLKRVKGALSEADIVEMWRMAHQEAFDQEYLKATYPNIYGDDAGAEDEEDEDEEDEDEDEGEFEDAMDTSGAPEVAVSAPSTVVTKGATQDVASVKPPVHQPVPGQPVLPLGFIHKFMVLGEAGGK
ncbi:hypothetical protein IAQ61_009663 [Plenodomus lingam]|uniref:Predicted protein n=1 Tax=Leptosphaeria maculans (strain JN3 / isolate v23.1.3 / race Av1-4-5-6-7-8) TaxID=985895 RepID=E4ZT63_LEPMJ|nr:predicted protein [Plenodomus lingam JN3]KAH9863386.1 hypothetical protein IAQ61_009663 [Plenodomus lingam]CBX94494.1 predicted protein [Plenodomus lingam JN3]